jgi:quercetin dioxygenase-like cupin family protein
MSTKHTQLRQRLISKADFAPCSSAFIDVRIPGSEGKQNYCFIGSGVSQNSEQVINMQEPHGFQIGGVQLPQNHVNNLHLHFTAEVFICARGEWTLFWGVDGNEGEYVLRPGDIASIPTWIFRGFRNTGPDDGFMFTALGGDDTGGIIWGPSVLRQAAETGMYLTRDNQLLDTHAGQSLPPAEQLLQPVEAADLVDLKHYTPAQMLAERVVLADERNGSAALLCNVLPNYAVELTPIIGFGLSQQRNVQAKISNPHGFSLDHLRGQQGEKLAPYRLANKQVLINQQGQWRLTLDTAEGPLDIMLDEWSIYSVPAGVWRSLEAVGEGMNRLVSVCAGDAPQRMEWSAEIIQQAQAAGWALDASGYMAPARLLPA